MLENEDDNLIESENSNEHKVDTDENIYPEKIYMKVEDIEKEMKEEELSKEQIELIQYNAKYFAKYVWNWNESDCNYKFNLPKTIFSQETKVIKIGENYLNDNKEVKYSNPQDENGSSLRKEHLEQIWQRGEFCVDSTEPNLPYKWKLSKLAVCGVQNNIKFLKQCFTEAFNFLYLLKYRCIGDGNKKYKYIGVFFTSIFYALFDFFSYIFDLFLGVPSYYKSQYYIQQKIKHDDLIQFIRNNENFKLKLFCHQNYVGLNKISYDFLNQLWPKMKIENEKKFYKEGLTSNEIEQRLYVMQKEEYLNYIHKQDSFIKLENEFKCLDLLKAQQIIINITHENAIEKERLLKEFDINLQKNSIRYNSLRWKEEQTQTFTNELNKRLTSQTNERISKEIAEYNEANLIFNKNASFANNYDTLYQQAHALAEKEPGYSVKVKRICIRPYNVIRSKRRLSIALIDISTNDNNKNNETFIHQLEKHIHYKIKSTFCCWRLYLYIMRFFIYTWNIAVFSLKKAFYSCVSIQALCKFTLYTDDEIDEHTGTIIKSNPTYTFPRTLSNLKEWISTSREKFEEQPDKGIFGKNFTRIFNIIWNYFIKLIIFGLLILIFYPIIIIISTVFFIICFFISPVLSLLFIILEFLFYMLLYDGISKKFFPLITNFVWMVIIRFLLLFILNVYLMIMQPILAFVVSILGIILFVLRYVYDFIMYYLVKCVAKIPVIDTCFAWKIEGPGLFRDRFYNISDSDILILLRGKLESDQLSYYNVNTIKQLEKPEKDIKDKLEKVYDYFHLEIRPLPFINKSINFYKTKLSKLIERRQKQLPQFYKTLRVRFTQSRLNEVKELIKKYIIEFEKENGLEASIVMRNIKEHEDKYTRLVELYLILIFGNDIMESLEENDEIVYLDSKSSQISGVIDLISKKLLEDPNYSNREVKEKNRISNGKEVISRPKIATFRDVFDKQSYLYLDLTLLNEEERKNYLGISNEDNFIV